MGMSTIFTIIFYIVVALDALATKILDEREIGFTVPKLGFRLKARFTFVFFFHGVLSSGLHTP